MDKKQILITKAKGLVATSGVFPETPSEDDPEGKFTKGSVMAKLPLMDEQKLHRFIITVEEMIAKTSLTENEMKEGVIARNKNGLLGIIKSPFGIFANRKVR